MRLHSLVIDQEDRGSLAAGETRSTYCVGMPHTSADGLSENWLLKEAGHLHWQALSNRFGFSSFDFKDPMDRRLYAAFIAVQLRKARLFVVNEGARLEILTKLVRVSEARFRSLHAVMCDDEIIAEIELISAFVARGIISDNRSVASSRLSRDSERQNASASMFSSLYFLSQKFRRDQWVEHRGFRRDDAKAERTIRFRPCPLNDFNGAAFLYFANFQMFADRAEWEWNISNGTISRTLAREIFYTGNINVGDSIEIVRCGVSTDGANDRKVQDTWSRVIRVSDNKIIADIFTRRQF